MKGTDNSNGIMNSSWDAIVIGSGVGGLTPAGILAREGRRVLVLEKHSIPGGCTQVYGRNGYEWDAGLHYVGEMNNPNSNLRKVFDYITNGNLQWADMPDVYNRIVIGERSYEHVAGVEPFKKRMKEYFPDEAEAIDRYIDLISDANRLAQSFFAEKVFPEEIGKQLYDQMSSGFRRYADQTALEVLKKLTDNDELIAVLCGNCGDYVSTPGHVSFAMQAMLAKHYIGGASFPVGGSGRIAETIGDVIRSAGGDILVNAEVVSIIINSGKACGVKLKDGREFHSEIVISDAGIRNTVLRMLPEEAGKETGLAEKCMSLEMSRTPVVLNIGIKESNRTLGLAPANIWIHKSPDMDGDFEKYSRDPENTPMPMHFISIPSVKDPAWEDRFPGRITIDICSVTTWSLFKPYAGTEWGRRSSGYEVLKKKLAREMLSQVLRFFPHLEGKIDYMELATPLTFNHFLGREEGAIMALASTPHRYQQKWLRAPSPIPNLFFTGQDLSSGGIAGAVAGGVIAASSILGKNVVQELPVK